MGWFRRRVRQPEVVQDPTSPAGTKIEFYWRPGCPFCMALDRGLKRASVPVTKINIWDDRSAAARVRSVADGNETVPTVFVNGQALVNPSVRQVLRAAKSIRDGS